MSVDLSDEEWKEYVHALKLFNTKYFWECHEVLEDIWMTKQAPLKTFLQGIIQSAAAFYHVLGENPRGVIKLSQDAQNKFLNFSDSHLGVDLVALKAALVRFASEAQEILDQKRSLFSLDQIPILNVPEQR